MPRCDVQAALKVALELQGDVCIRGLGEHAAVVAGMDSFGPAPIARNGSTAWFQPDPPMWWQGNRRLRPCVRARNGREAPGSAGIPILKQQIDMASAGVVRCSGVTQ